MDRDFNKEILHLVDMLREVSKRQKSDSVLNLVLKLDFNHYLTKMAAAEAWIKTYNITTATQVHSFISNKFLLHLNNVFCLNSKSLVDIGSKAIMKFT